ncbi:MAG: class I SAM-dependent methyltransferase [Kordiimonas sp.]
MKLKHLLLSAAIALPFQANTVWADQQHITDAVNSPERPDNETVRDAKRKPSEVLEFIGVKPGMHVADLLGGGGYYTDIFSRAVGETGSVLNYINYYVRGRFVNFFGPGGPVEKRANGEQWKKNVTLAFDDMENFKTENPLDVAFMALFYHDTAWQGTERDKMNKAIFDALKPGGLYVIVDHSAEEGSGIRDVKTLHRIDKSFVVNEIEAAGFKLVEESNLLANPEDTRDFNVFRDARTNRDNTDRFILKFQKPQ